MHIQGEKGGGGSKFTKSERKYFMDYPQEKSALRFLRLIFLLEFFIWKKQKVFQVENEMQTQLTSTLSNVSWKVKLCLYGGAFFYNIDRSLH